MFNGLLSSDANSKLQTANCDDCGNAIPANGFRKFCWNLARDRIEFSAISVWIHSNLI
uniref:GM09783p n=1 Tax=Drosophila melanogaster TaxID=7227 RepID=Q95S40_DROME|nr:GM09783p [Drosophila melanogaster]